MSTTKIKPLSSLLLLFFIILLSKFVTEEEEEKGTLHDLRSQQQQ